ncbi:MAG: aldehyde ferredoxin oxidoreductase N-terminal domain-containing protein [Clostridia bacterium]
MATNLGAYAGKVLKIDLTNRTFNEYPINDKDRKLFLGGKTFAARIIYDYIKSPIDPLGEKNIVVVSSCPLNGTGCPSSSRFNISTISPLTGILTSSNCGGTFALAMKRGGLDAIILTGKCDEFVYLDVDCEKVDFINAEHLRGKKTGETQEIIGGTKSKIVIGPAGEHLVKYACAVNEDRAAGRGAAV